MTLKLQDVATGRSVRSCRRVAVALTAAVAIFLGQLRYGKAETVAKTLHTTAGREATILKKIVVSYLRLLGTYPDLRSSTHVRRDEQVASGQMDMSISSMLFLFDPLNDPQSLGVFASLDSYYLGEHSAEIYDCLARRKGRALKPFLGQVVRRSVSECIDEFGEIAKPKVNQVAICLTKQDAIDRAKRLLEEIDRNVGCTDQDLLE